MTLPPSGHPERTKVSSINRLPPREVVLAVVLEKSFWPILGPKRAKNARKKRVKKNEAVDPGRNFGRPQSYRESQGPLDKALHGLELFHRVHGRLGGQNTCFLVGRYTLFNNPFFGDFVPSKLA